MRFESFDAEYVQLLTQGDRSVENHFAGYFGELLQIKLRARLRRLTDIDDVCQETLLRVLRQLREKSGLRHPERLGAFVNSVCDRVLLEQLRFNNRHAPIPDDIRDVPVECDPDQPLVNQQRKERIAQVLDCLNERDRRVLRLLFLEGKNKSEICRRLDVDRSYLRVIVHRAKRRLREILRAEGVTDPLRWDAYSR